MKKNATPKSTNKNASAKQKIPAAVGTRIMSSASQFRTKLVRDPKKYPGSIGITGHEYLDAVSVTTATVGSNLLTIYLNPNEFANTRLQKYAELYDKYIFRRFTLHYTSADPSTATGQYIIAYDRDYADTTPSADSDGIREYFAMAGSQISNVYLSSSFKCPLGDPQDFFYTNNTGYDGRLVFQGQLYMAAVSGTTFHGSLWIEYECEFFDPQLDPAIPARITSPGMAVSLTSDGSSDFDAFSYLTNETQNGPRFSVVSATPGNVPVATGIHFGYKGLLLTPGSYYFENRYAMKTDVTGEGITSFSIVPCSYTKNVAEGVTHATVSSQTSVSVIENSGLGIADTNSSATLRFFLSIPPSAGVVWLFLSGLTSAPSTTVTYADAILSIIIAKVSQISSTMSTKSLGAEVLIPEDNGTFLLDETFPASMKKIRAFIHSSPESKEDLEEKVKALKSKLKSIKESELKSQSPEIIKKT